MNEILRKQYDVFLKASGEEDSSEALFKFLDEIDAFADIEDMYLPWLGPERPYRLSIKLHTDGDFGVSLDDPDIIREDEYLGVEKGWADSYHAQTEAISYLMKMRDTITTSNRSIKYNVLRLFAEAVDDIKKFQCCYCQLGGNYEGSAIIYWHINNTA